MAGCCSLLLRFVPPAGRDPAQRGWRGASPIRSPRRRWGLVIWWPFLIFSTLFVVWRQRGFLAGVGVAAATHALQNLGPALVLAHRAR